MQSFDSTGALGLTLCAACSATVHQGLLDIAV
jgi:hypothetical protein